MLSGGNDMYFAKVIAGHDKNHVYFIFKQDNSFVYLVNGDTKKICNPRKKNQKHIQIIKNIPQAIMDILKNDDVITDEIISKMLKAYKKLQVK